MNFSVTLKDALLFAIFVVFLLARYTWFNQAAERQGINFSATLKDALVEELGQ